MCSQFYVSLFNFLLFLLVFEFSKFMGDEVRFRKVSGRVEFSITVVAFRAMMYQTWFYQSMGEFYVLK